jgi:hypothetical protein
MVDQRQPGYRPSECRRTGVWWNAEGFVPGELDFLEPHLDGFGRHMLQNRCESDRPTRFVSATAGPVVDLRGV